MTLKNIHHRSFPILSFMNRL